MRDKDEFVPATERKQDHSPLGPSDLAYLQVLVTKGEGLLLSSLKFGQAEALLRTGHAKVVRTYEIDHDGGTQVLTIIEPTELGKALSETRDRARVAWLKQPGKPTPLTKE
jgi:hypothetical protein